MAEFHEQFAWVVVALNAAAGLWVLAANWLEQLRRREMWWFVGVAQLAMMTQVVIGVIVQNQEGREAPDDFHLFYGFLTVVSVGILYSYRQQVQQHLYLLYGLGSLWIMGLGMRALFLGT